VFILAPLDPGIGIAGGGAKNQGPKGRVLRPKGPKIEARKAESRGWILGEGAASPLRTS